MLRRDLAELAPPEVGAEDGFLIVVDGAEREAGLPRGTGLLGRLAKRLGPQAIGPPVWIDGDHVRRGQPGEVSSHSVGGKAEILGELALGPGRRRERPRDREPLGIREEPKQLLRSHSTSASMAFGTVSVGTTLYQACSIFPSSSIRNDERKMPFQPGPNGSPHTP